MTTNEQLTWEQRLQYPTRTVTFDTHPDVKEYIVSYDEIQELNKVEKNLLLDQAIKVLGGMEKDTQWFVDNYFTAENAYPSFDYEGEDRWVAITAKETHNLALSQAISKLKELKE